MKNVHFTSIKIAGMACGIPTHQMNTMDYVEYFGEKVIKRFVRTTGIKSRYVGNGHQTASDLCVVAAQALFKERKIKREDVDLIIFLTQNPDYQTPSTAFVIQKRLRLNEQCVCFDVNMGCTSFLHGISIAASMINAGSASNALVMMGDARLPHPISRDTAATMMFGEAGGVIALTKGNGDITMDLFSDGYHFDWIMNPFGERLRDENDNFDLKQFFDFMDGGAVFNFAVGRVPEAINDFCKKKGTVVNDYDAIILHQANGFILRHIANEIGIDDNKLAISMDRYGNTNGASIPVTIVDYIEQSSSQQDEFHFLVSGFGIGLSWGVMDMKVNREDVLPMIFTDDYNKEAKELACYN